MKINKVLIFVSVFLICLVFYPIFISTIIAGGDYISPNSQAYLSIFFPIASWDPSGLGWGIIPLLHYVPMNFFLGWTYGLTPVYTDRIVWWGLFLLLSFIGSLYLTKKIFRKKNLFALSPLIFILNTYVLLILSGGQIAGIGLAYATIPFAVIELYVLLMSFTETTKFPLKTILIYSLILSILIVFDLRIAYIFLVISVIFYIVFQLFLTSWNKILKTVLAVFVLPFGISGLLNVFWVIPTYLFHFNPIESLGAAYNSSSAVKFFSFAQFENSISLLHPNWPENIFGKTGFMRPEFLIFPILAYAALLFIHKESKEIKAVILSFALIGLIGAFLGKGANDPFGGIYLWAFVHIPGFIMFRDPTKWYVMVAVSYSVLIPYSVWKIAEKVSGLRFQILKKVGKEAIVVLFILFWIISIRQAVFGQLGGTFKRHNIPKEYIALEKFLSSQPEFFRTFWVPTTQRYGYSSLSHPAISGFAFYHEGSMSAVLKDLNQKNAQLTLREAGVRYVIVPFDSEGEIFLKDRKYDNGIYISTVKNVEKISYLKPAHSFGKLVVLQVPNPKKHIFLEGMGDVLFTQISPVKYTVKVANVQKGERIVFSDAFDPYWKLRVGNISIKSHEYDGRFNSFELPKSGNYSFEIYYTPQVWVNIGLIISAVSLFSIMVLLILQYKRAR